MWPIVWVLFCDYILELIWIIGSNDRSYVFKVKGNGEVQGEGKGEVQGER